MSDQIILAWKIQVAGTSFGPAAAAAALAAVELYQDETTDPILGQLFGLTVDDDDTTSDATSATRTLTLNMTHNGDAPPPFPCHPRTSTPPVLPYPLRRAVTLPGFFFPQNGLMNVPTTVSQIPSLNNGDVIQFLSQEGVFYTVANVGPTSLNLTTAYTGRTKNTTASKEVKAPVTLAAVYSTSPLDTDSVSTVPTIAAGAGARTVDIIYDDSEENGPFTSTVHLTGRRPAAVPLAMGSVDIAVIIGFKVASVGNFANSVGQITLCELSSELPDVLSNTTAEEFKTRMTDEAQMLIALGLAYLPPSYFALAQQSTSAPALLGDFIVTTGSKDVQTTEDNSGLLAAGNLVEFAVQPGAIYTVEDVTDKILRLTTVFTGIDTNNAGSPGDPNINAGTKGNLGTTLTRKPTGATRVGDALAQQPGSSPLSVPLGQFAETQVAAPPPNPPLSPASVPANTFLSDHFTQTLQLALAGIAIEPQPITLA